MIFKNGIPLLIGLMFMLLLPGCGSFEWFPSDNTSTTPALSITTTSLPEGTVGGAYTANLVATGGTSPYTWSLASGTLPDGLSISGSTITGTPTTAGNSTITLKVTDTAGSTATSASLTITITGALAISTGTLPAAPTGIAYSQQLVSGGSPPYTFANLSTASGRLLPHGLTLSTTGVLSGTPEARADAFAGTGIFTINLSATDSSSPAQSAQQTVSLTVPTTGRMYDTTGLVYAEGIGYLVSSGSTLVTAFATNTDTVDHIVTINIANYDDTGAQITTQLTQLTTVTVPANTLNFSVQSSDFTVYGANNWRITAVTTQ